MSRGWIGVDLDGTLAHFDGKWRGPAHIGEPIEPMVKLVKRWLAHGITAKIFTARVYAGNSERRQIEVAQRREAIENWCRKHLGQALEVTNIKDDKMFRLFDDRAVQVRANTGEIVGDFEEA